MAKNTAEILRILHSETSSIRRERLVFAGGYTLIGFVLFTVAFSGSWLIWRVPTEPVVRPPGWLPSVPVVELPVWFAAFAWVIIYPFMGLAIRNIWPQRRERFVKWTLGVYGLWLVFNIAWPVAAFTLGLFGDVLVDGAGLLLAPVTVWMTAALSWRSATFLVPLLVWLPITFYTGYSVWIAVG